MCDLIVSPGLTYDTSSNRLYWVNIETNTIQFYDFATQAVTTVTIEDNLAHPTAIVPYNGLIFYADQMDQAIHMADMTTGVNNTVLRNNTGQ
jgi:integrin beta 2